MTALEVIETKVPELSRIELIVLLETVVHNLKVHNFALEEDLKSKSELENKEKELKNYKIPFKIYDYKVTYKSDFSREEIYSE